MPIDAKSKHPSVVRCPVCGSQATSGPPNCPACGAWLAGPQAEELWWIEGELQRVESARAWLIDRRKALLAELRQLAQTSATGAAGGASAPAASTMTGVTQVAESARAELPAGPLPTELQEQVRPELSGRAVARLLLAAGAALVVIAAIAFTLANWSHIGPLGRSAMLLGVTALLLALPRPLAARGLSATAEAVAAAALALTIGDAYLLLLLFHVSLSSGPFVVAVATATLAGMWAAYGAVARLKLPRLAAIVVGQLPGLFVTAGLVRLIGGPSFAIAGPIAVALVLTCAADCLIARWVSRSEHLAERLTSSIVAVATWVAGIGLVSAAVVGARAGLLWLALTFCVAAVIGITMLPTAVDSWLPAAPIAAVSGTLLTVGLAAAVTDAIAPQWQLAGFAAAGTAVTCGALALARRMSALPAAVGTDQQPGTDQPGTDQPGTHQPGPDRARLDGLGTEPPARTRLEYMAAGSALVVGVVGLFEIPIALAALVPLHRLGDVWSGGAASPGPATPATPLVLALVAVACWLVPKPARRWSRSAAVAACALALGSIPAAIQLDGPAALAVLTAAAALMLGASAVLGDNAVTVACAVSGTALGASAALWSLTTPAATITELAALTVVFGSIAAIAKNAPVVQLTTGGALVAATGLAAAVPLAKGLPASSAAFAVLGVAVVGIATATSLSRVRPRHALVLDVGAGLVVLLAATMAAREGSAFAVLAALAAVLASTTAWLRAGRRRTGYLAAAAFAVLAALAVEARPLALVLFTPFGGLAHAWQDHPHAELSAARAPGLALAVLVLAGCAVAGVVAAGTWGGGRGRLNAVAVALPMVTAAAALGGGLGYGPTVGILIVLSLAQTAWAGASESLTPAGGAVAGASLALAWSLVSRSTTLVVLGALAVAYLLSAWRARLERIRIGAASLAVLAAAGLAGAAVLAAGGTAWQSGLALLPVAAAAQLAAARLSSSRKTSLATEATGWVVAAIGTAQCAHRPGPASLALGISGLLCIAVAARDDRRPVLWVGLALTEVAWCIWLFTTSVTAAEPYTVPAAAGLIGFGWYLSRRRGQARSWLTFGPGLVMLLLPSLAEAWHDPGWVRPLALGLAATGVALIGARKSLQAPLLIGIVVALLDAGRELAPDVRRVVDVLPTWVPIAVGGAILLWAGATYEARLKNLGRLRRTLARMR